MKNKKYSGYRAFDYLEANTDYQAFKLAAELDRVPSQKVAVSPQQEERVQRLLDDNLVISLHDHPIVMPEQPAEIFEQRRTGRDVTGYAGLSVSGLDAVFDNLMDGTALVTSKSGWKWDDIIIDLGMRLCDIAHQDLVIRAETPDEIFKACAARGGVIGIEAAPHTTLTAKHPRHSIESFMEHFEYIANLVGIEHVAFGPDTMFGDHVALHNLFAASLSIASARGQAPIDFVEYVDGIENPAEAFPNIVRWLVTHDYSDHDIARSIGGNV